MKSVPLWRLQWPQEKKKPCAKRLRRGVDRIAFKYHINLTLRTRLKPYGGKDK